MIPYHRTPSKTQGNGKAGGRRVGASAVARLTLFFVKLTAWRQVAKDCEAMLDFAQRSGGHG